ncbi:unnamed protein product [Prunus armeniaca]|uniref:Uncharacterized protein n=1 Tax=Prunus armeniaca TaxID=36596 RepID=A0A6J5THN5_PRUAR|nr:unnamed protein product [Prunus armeniaca]CAB4293299.1 unnamed protein product [Prunus armeniaca]
MDGHDADDPKQSTADMTAFVQNLLQQMVLLKYRNFIDLIDLNYVGTCFLDHHDALDEMGNRIDELEQSINDLRTEMGVEGSPSPSAPSKSNIEPKSADDSTNE